MVVVALVVWLCGCCTGLMLRCVVLVAVVAVFVVIVVVVVVVVEDVVVVVVVVIGGRVCGCCGCCGCCGGRLASQGVVVVAWGAGEAWGYWEHEERETRGETDCTMCAVVCLP